MAKNLSVKFGNRYAFAVPDPRGESEKSVPDLVIAVRQRRAVQLCAETITPSKKRLGGSLDDRYIFVSQKEGD